MSMRDELIRSHKEIARTAGQIALTIEKGRVSPQFLSKWGSLLRKVGAEFEEVAKLLEPPHEQ